MAIKVADNFRYQGRKPLDDRLVFNTIADMEAIKDSIIYEGAIAYNKETKKFYTYNPSNTVDATLGKWKEFSAGSSSSSGISLVEYTNNTNYEKDTLVYLNNKIARVVADYTSANLADVKDSWDDDIINEKIIPINGLNIKGWEENTTYNEGDMVFGPAMEFGIVATGPITVPDNLSHSQLITEWRNNVLAHKIVLIGENEIVLFYRGSKYYNNQIIRDQLTDNLYLALQDFEADQTITNYADNLQDCIDKGYLKLISRREIKQFAANTHYNYGDWISPIPSSSIIGVATQNFTTSANGDTWLGWYEEIDNGNIALLNDNTIEDYGCQCQYLKGHLIKNKYTNELYLTLKMFTAIDGVGTSEEDKYQNSVQADIDAGNMILVNKNKAILIKYESNTEYKKDSLVYLDDKVARVVLDYTSANESDDLESFKSDTDNGNLIIISRHDIRGFSVYPSNKHLNAEMGGITNLQFSDLVTSGMTINDLRIGGLVYCKDHGTIADISFIDVDADKIEVTTINIGESDKLMPIAPDERKYTIINPGINYAVGNIIETTEIGQLVEVKKVGVNGEIEEVQKSSSQFALTTGSGAVINTEIISYVGNGKNWLELEKVDLTDHALIRAYEQGTAYKKDTLVYLNNKLSRVFSDYVSDNTTGKTLEESFKLDILNNKLTASKVTQDAYIGIYESTVKLNSELRGTKLLKFANLLTSGITIDDLSINSLIYGEGGNLGKITSIDVANDEILVTTIVNHESFHLPVEFQIEDGGTGYVEGDIISTDNAEYFCEVVEVDSNGTITKVKESKIKVPNFSGTNAIITCKQLNLGSSGIKEYKQNTSYAKDDLVYFNEKLARVNETFISDNTQTNIEDSFNLDTSASGELILLTSEATGDALITEDVTSNLNVGNIKVNDIIKKDTSFTDFVKKLLVKEILPTGKITSFKSGLNLKGTTITAPLITAEILTLGDATINFIEFYKGNTLEDTQPYIAGTNVYTFNTSDITSDTSVSIKIWYTHKDGTTLDVLTYSANYTFVNYSYFGLTDSIPASDSDITALTSTLKNTKAFTGTVSPINKHIVYAYPANLGELTSIKDQNGFDYIAGSYTKITMLINGEDYKVYYLTSPTTNNNIKQIYV